MEVKITLSESVIEMLEEWRSELMTDYRTETKFIKDDAVRKAMRANYEVISQADYRYLAQLYLVKQDIERR